MKSLLSQTFLSLIIIFSFNSTYADDFIKMANRKSWKVQDCAVDGDSYKVKVCYSNDYCKNKYPITEYSCEKGIACGESFIGSSSFYKGTKTKRFHNVQKFDRAISAAVSFSKLKDVNSQAWESLSSSKLSDMDIPIVFYTSKQGETEKKAIAELQKKKLPASTLLFSLTKNLNTYEIKSISQMPTNPNTQQLASANEKYNQLIALITEAISQELSDCPE